MQLAGNAAEIIQRVEQLNVWRRGSERAPHKPLLLLLALGRLSRREPRLVSFGDLEPKLSQLLEEFGPPRRSVHPEYPFWRLQNDGLWVVEEKAALTRRRSNTDPLKSELLAHAVLGGFPESVHRTLVHDPALVSGIAGAILQAHFPESIHGDILQAVGLDLEQARVPRAICADFRDEVLRAYEYACAVCGYSVMLGSSNMGLDAAHIKWRQAGGPNVIPNGLACCTVHHRALDRGAIGVSEELTVLVSADLHGSACFHDWFVAFAGMPLRKPSSGSWAPREDYLAWHRSQVFRHPPRGI